MFWLAAHCKALRLNEGEEDDAEARCNFVNGFDLLKLVPEIPDICSLTLQP